MDNATQFCAPMKRRRRRENDDENENYGRSERRVDLVLEPMMAIALFINTSSTSPLKSSRFQLQTARTRLYQKKNENNAITKYVGRLSRSDYVLMIPQNVEKKNEKCPNSFE